MVVAQLVKARFIVATEPTREGQRPERTVYELTGEGRAELRDWLRELVEEPRHEYPHFVAALPLIGALPPRVPAGARNGPSFMARRAPRHLLRRSSSHDRIPYGHRDRRRHRRCRRGHGIAEGRDRATIYKAWVSR